MTTTGVGEKRIYQNDVGTAFYVETGSDLTGASKAYIYVQKPDGAEVTWVGAPAYNPDPETDHTLGKTCILYTLKAADTTQVGWHMLHGYVEIGAGKWTSNLGSFRVWQRFAA